MPELGFEVTAVEPVRNGLTPLLQFRLRISNSPDSAGVLQEIQALILQAQIQIAAPQRDYSPREKARLLDVFGTPDRWGQTLHNRFWANTNTTTGAFREHTETALAVQCTIDLDILATKYFDALEGGEVPLLFLFSGSVFYRTETGLLQVQRISWQNECTYRMSISAWKELMEFHYPNKASMSISRETYEKLCAYRRENGFASWEETIDRLLSAPEPLEIRA